MRNTLVIGASINPERYSFKAITMLRAHNKPVLAFGPKVGVVSDIPITNEWDSQWKVDTITLYLNPQRQEAYYDKIIALQPRRVIFNPGTENKVFSEQLSAHGIAS